MTIGVTRRRIIGAGLTIVLGPIVAACSGSSVPSAAPTTATEIAPETPTAPGVQPSPTPQSAPTLSPVPTAPALPTAPLVPTARPTSTAGPRDGSFTSPDYSVHVFLWGGFETTKRDLNLARELGFGWVKQRFEWRYVEPHAKGKLEWNEPDRIVDAVATAGLRLIARIDNQPRWSRSDPVWPIDGPPDKLADLGDFLRAMAERYRGRIHAYQIWNEPNLAREWGNKPPNPTQYVEMLKVGHAAIKAGDPNATVISAGLSPTTASGAIAMPDVEFADKMYQAGAKPYFDMLGIHAAGFKAPPEMAPSDIAKDTTLNHGEGAAGRVYGFRHAEDLRDVMIAHGDAAKRIAVLEFGWTSDDRPNSPYRWHAVTEDEKAKYLARAFDYATRNWQPWIGPMTVIYIADPAWTRDDEQYHWAITGSNGSTRPAFAALAQMEKSGRATPLTLPVAATATVPAKTGPIIGTPTRAPAKP